MDLGVGETILLKCIFIGCDNEDWIHLAQNRVQWRTLVNTIMNLWVP